MAGFKLSVEVPLFLIFFAITLLSAIVMNLIMYKTCYTLMDYPEANCSRLGRDTDNATKALEQIVQTKASYVTTITEMVPGSVPVFLTLVIGSWSDKYGRRPAMIFVLSCTSVSMIIGAGILLIKESTPYMQMVASIPSMLCGGVATFFNLALAYMNDIASEETRSVRMATFEVISIFCACFGNLLSTPLLYATSYAAVYGVSASLIVLATVYIVFFLPESLKQKSTEKTTFSTIFTCDLITSMFKIVTKKRPRRKRTVILIIIATIGILGIVSGGELNIKSLYLRNHLSWTLTDKNIFTSWSSVVIIIGTISLTIVLQKILKIKKSILILSGLFAQTIGIVLYAIAKNNWFIYGTVPFATVGGLINPMLRTKLGQTIAAEEMGKVFSLISVITTLETLVSGLAYSLVYNETIDTHPETFCWLSLGLTDFCVLLMGIVMLIESRNKSPEKDISSLEN